ncbi:Methyl-CpG-binding domain protein 4 [Cyphellophora attinorum]|uniref:Methyl-CpG-binding domain protein 4 n=1 Tax=Cyphellophora attinorum TaxID=1664694 RepID=A0A0N0NJG4_9EURO|nr:Methyl-CpG-binding domain protein 4 [Phialophora attinorum]KPI36951.1 Methyl-CpG-binding domain protein 4 [Phialophora attinorum]
MAPVQPPSARPMPTSTEQYGLIEEEFADNPFQLLIVCIFLNKTRGKHAIPAARRFLSQFPDPDGLARAEYKETVVFFESLGLPHRAQWVIDLANTWLLQPPKAGVVHRKCYKKEVTCESEVAHLTGVGQYASDAWRIFCKDELYRQAGFPVDIPEWTIVKPKDKELRAYLTWKRNTSKKQTLVMENQEAEGLLADLNRLSLGDSVKPIQAESSHASVYAQTFSTVTGEPYTEYAEAFFVDDSHTSQTFYVEPHVAHKQPIITIDHSNPAAISPSLQRLAKTKAGGTCLAWERSGSAAA